ncbi:hypothetical protein B0H17DRAFT_1183651 [Mycena rosella]|uniref:Uncharacterized protein n=1 Tax=Mycena rosella TaxID=1033263 RepID=A0AAD7G8U9_MYCRO|nr:hypothetical protein B0H17DRAFT_1183651 [Mycena rosella]
MKTMCRGSEQFDGQEANFANILRSYSARPVLSWVNSDDSRRILETSPEVDHLVADQRRPEALEIAHQVPAVPERKPHATMDDPFSDGATPNSSLVPAHKSPATFVSNFWAILTSGSERGRKRKIIDHDAVPPSPPLPVLQIPPRPREKVKTGIYPTTSRGRSARLTNQLFPTPESPFMATSVVCWPCQPPPPNTLLTWSPATDTPLRTPLKVFDAVDLSASRIAPKIIWIRRKRGVLAQRTDRHRHGLDLPFYLARVVFGIFPPIGPKSGTI